MPGGGREYYFRPRPGGAMLLKITHDPRLRRTEMHRIAGVAKNTGDISVTEGHELTEAETALIVDWLAKARGDSAVSRGARALEEIGHIAHWAQFQAKPDELAQVSEDLFWAMQDLREVLVRKMAQRASAKADPGEPGQG